MSLKGRLRLEDAQLLFQDICMIPRTVWFQSRISALMNMSIIPYWCLKNFLASKLGSQALMKSKELPQDQSDIKSTLGSKTRSYTFVYCSKVQGKDCACELV